MKVSKNSFRPPPQVESSVVRVEPLNPPSPIPFVEWDGLMRILFLRKNKTVAANFKTTSVLDMLEKNYRTWCSMNGVPLVEPFDCRGKVMAILEASGVAEMRAAKMDLDDFMRLLLAFNEVGLHFC
jgi:18S rRNA (adenine1779-N6/adenine1780-N6)-dimethyltransferase